MKCVVCLFRTFAMGLVLLFCGCSKISQSEAIALATAEAITHEHRYNVRIDALGVPEVEATSYGFTVDWWDPVKEACIRVYVDHSGHTEVGYLQKDM